ncbi:hypothetical protein CSQ90_26510 [Janthinobacterium sp. BJB303]|nr:hypothetical protein CSQ90_26510 [Janthinobacterium sp. BJB303]
MPFKYNADGTIATSGEGAQKLPIFIHADGREAPFDADTTVSTIGRLNGEAKSHREAKEAAELRLKSFEGIEDGAAALAALTTVKNLGAGELKTAAQVQEIKDAAAKSARESVEAATRAAADKEKVLTEQNSTLTQQLNNHIIGGAFASSKFISEKLAIPADIAQKVFADRLKVEGGKLVPTDANGNPLFSAVRHGEHADFEEAIEVYVNQYPNKDKILKGSGASGGGASSGGSGGGGAKSITRAQFDAMDGAARAAAMKGGATISE